MQQTMLKWISKDALRSKVASAPAPVPTPEPTGPIAPSPTPTTQEESPLDAEIVNDLQDLMGNDYHSLIRIYLEDSPKLIQQLQTALNRKDIVALVAPSHTLKSSSANLGALKLSKIAMAIEKSARNGDLELPARETPALVSEYEKVKAALAEIIA
jgi:HPt (histidine-containing phosphotransfer) domain-containing protein